MSISTELGTLNIVADAVVSYIRVGHLPTEEEADVLNRLPQINLLRTRIKEEDLAWVFDVLEKRSGEVAGLYLSFLRQYTKRPEVQARLRERWESAAPFLRAHLMWRILDDPDLPEEWHQRLFDFVLAEWSTFQQVSLKFLGTPQTVVVQALKRIGDPSFPDSKKWAYLCRVPEVAEDQEAAKALVALGLQMKDPFTREVAQKLLDRFFQTKQHETRA